MHKKNVIYTLRKERLSKEIKEYVDKEFAKIDKDWEEKNGRN